MSSLYLTILFFVILFLTACQSEKALPTMIVLPTAIPLPTSEPTTLPLEQVYRTVIASYAYSCPRQTCNPTRFSEGVSFRAMGVEHGDMVFGNDIWYRGRLGAEELYMHSSALIAGIAVATPTAVYVAPPVQPAVVQPNNVQQPSSNVQSAPSRSWDCSGNIYNCDSFGSDADLSSYFNSCPGDPSELDRDGDGRPCELD